MTIILKIRICIDYLVIFYKLCNIYSNVITLKKKWILKINQIIDNHKNNQVRYNTLRISL